MFGQPLTLKTQSGADIYIVESTPCGLPRRDGTICTHAQQKLFIRFKDSSKHIRRIPAVACQHHIDDWGGEKLMWTSEMLIRLYDLIHAGKTFKDIDSILKSEFKNALWPEGTIKRRANGEYKEFDCAAKKRYEDDCKKDQPIPDTVWDSGLPPWEFLGNIRWSDDAARANIFHDIQHYI